MGQSVGVIDDFDWGAGLPEGHSDIDIAIGFGIKIILWPDHAQNFTGFRVKNDRRAVSNVQTR